MKLIQIIPIEALRALSVDCIVLASLQIPADASEQHISFLVGLVDLRASGRPQPICQLWGPGDILVIGAAALCHGELAVFWLDLVCEVVILIEAGRIHRALSAEALRVLLGDHYAVSSFA